MNTHNDQFELLYIHLSECEGEGENVSILAYHDDSQKKNNTRMNPRDVQNAK